MCRFISHLLTGRRPRQLDQEIGFSLLARLDPALCDAFAGSEHRDGYRAVEEVLRMAALEDDDAIRREVDRFYEVARESLSSVWVSVKAVAKVVRRDEDLDRQGFDAAIGDADLYAPVFAVQRASGLLPTRGASSGQLVESSMAVARTIKKATTRPAATRNRTAQH